MLTPWMSLRDALSVMLDEQVITGVVVAADGRALGVLTVDEVRGGAPVTPAPTARDRP